MVRWEGGMEGKAVRVAAERRGSAGMGSMDVGRLQAARQAAQMRKMNMMVRIDGTALPFRRIEASGGIDGVEPIQSFYRLYINDCTLILSTARVEYSCSWR